MTQERVLLRYNGHKRYVKFRREDKDPFPVDCVSLRRPISRRNGPTYRWTLSLRVDYLDTPLFLLIAGRNMLGKPLPWSRRHSPERPLLLEMRSSKGFIVSTCCFAALTDLFLYSIVSISRQGATRYLLARLCQSFHLL